MIRAGRLCPLCPSHYITSLRCQWSRSHTSSITYYAVSARRIYANAINSKDNALSNTNSGCCRQVQFNHPYCVHSSGGESEQHSEDTVTEQQQQQQQGTEVSEERRPQKMKLGPWRPLKRLTRSEMSHMRSLRALQPDEWTTAKLSKTFGVSDSAVRRILRSKFAPSEEVEERQERKVREQRMRRRERHLSDRLSSDTDSKKDEDVNIMKQSLKEV